MDEEVSSEESIDCEDVQIDTNCEVTKTKKHGPHVDPKKPKRVVEVRASKGRMLRYLRLPKAVDFMSPDLTEWFSEEQRKNLFAQLKANKD
ncbi:Apoptosis-antagonizing transcription factor C-terminal [Fasciolopsis buskii]|uniref:Apoptosis-antagonizing transcription factor C-terminal n=1 Tax=Fasciolopsis buskii TaxID=27845 RepID=A0A8E0VL94_9TREM|nr:Apoptosis-antagonizing transcription factor C-terminal [Fasciolopsis buski]